MWLSVDLLNFFTRSAGQHSQIAFEVQRKLQTWIKLDAYLLMSLERKCSGSLAFSNTTKEITMRKFCALINCMDFTRQLMEQFQIDPGLIVHANTISSTSLILKQPYYFVQIIVENHILDKIIVEDAFEAFCEACFVCEKI